MSRQIPPRLERPRQPAREELRGRIGAAMVAAYRRQPQTDDELAGLDDATRALVNEEPW